MKILYDHQIFSFQEYGGISEYFYRLIRGIKRTKNEIYVEGKYSNNIFLPKLKTGLVSVLSWFRFPLKNVLMFYLNELFGNRWVLNKNYDLLHITYYHPSFLTQLKGRPYVITVHDMIHELFPGECGRLQNQTIGFKKKTILAAKYIIAGSQNTKKDLTRIYSVPEDRISVIYYGNPLDGVKPKPISGLPKRYILFVGNRSGYKNFEFLVKAVTPILEKEKNLFLICAGGGVFTTQENSLFSRWGVATKIKQVGCENNKERAYIYTYASLHIIPSLYEGFGLTALEAFSRGCPVVASKTSSIPEVCGNAAVYVNPKSADSIRRGIKRVLDSKSLRKQMIELGHAQGKIFSWKKMVKETLKVYEKVIKF